MPLRVHRTLTTTAAPAVVQEYLADFENAVHWDPGTESCERVSGDGGPGTTYRNVSSFLGRRTELTYTARELVPARSVHFEGRNESFTGHDRIVVSPEGTGSRLDYDAEFAFSGAARLAVPLVALYLPFLASRTVEQLRRTLDAL
jgi:hypothetical protein